MAMKSLQCIVYALLMPPLAAQDPLYRGGASPQQPWRSSPPSRPYFEDYSSHFLDAEEWRRDRRARLFQIDLKSRNIGQLSLTSRLLWTNLACFVAQVFQPSLTQWGIKLSEPILAGRQLHRLVTPMFLHGGLFHLATNMISLQRVGGDVERLFGPGRFLATYLVAGVTGTWVSAYKSPNPSLGASGAVFGIVGAYFTFLTRNDWLLGDAGEAMTSAIGQTILMNVLLGAMNPVIDNWAHLGGFMGGAGMAYLFGPRLYLSELPTGGRLLIDRPVVRLPRALEELPDQTARTWQRMVRRMHVARYKADLPETPWRPRQRARPLTPNRSIKPKR